jgi:tryptophan-associated transmembrane protein
MAGDRLSPRIGGLMDHTESVMPTPVAGILGVVGGALLALGSFLTWAEVTGGGTSVTAKGVDGSDGYITLVAGLVAVVAGIMMARGTRRVLAVLVILAGIVGGGIGLYDALTAKDSVLDAAAEELAPTFGASAQEVRAALDQAIDAGQLSVSISIGLYVVIVGGVVALVGGIVGLRDAGEHTAPARTTTPAPPANTIGSTPPAPMPPPTSQPDPGA